MKLSEILGWPEKVKCHKEPDKTCGGCINNTALTSCDREIDREALAKILFKRHHDFLTWEEATYKEEFLNKADHIISTMPTWLRKGVRNEKI